MDVVSRHLVRDGIVGSLVAVDQPVPLDEGPRQQGTTAALRLHPGAATGQPPAQRPTMPDGWLERACAWVAAGLDQAALVRVSVTLLDAWLPAGDLRR